MDLLDHLADRGGRPTSRESGIPAGDAEWVTPAPRALDSGGLWGPVRYGPVARWDSERPGDAPDSREYGVNRRIALSHRFYQAISRHPVMPADRSSGS